MSPSLRREELLGRAKRGRVIALFASDSDVLHEELQSWAARSSPPSTLVTLAWQHAPRLADELDETVSALARASVTLYPELYASAAQRENAAVAPSAPTVRSVATRIRGASAKAVHSILEACRASTPPLLERLPHADRVRQLALALDPQQLVIELLVRSPEAPPPGALFAFGKGAAWLASNSGARVVMIVPAAFSRSTELDGVMYGAGAAENDNARGATKPVRKARKRAELSDSSDSVEFETFTRSASSLIQQANTAQSETIDGTPIVSVGAVTGKPHPGSDAEQKLHAKLTGDAELAPLFRYNQSITTVLGATHRVDVVWDDGKLVIEVDGHADHSRAGKFCHDRERDYQLLISGYRVIRIPEMFVLMDPELTLERIRKAVRYLRQENDGS